MSIFFIVFISFILFRFIYFSNLLKMLPLVTNWNKILLSVNVFSLNSDNNNPDSDIFQIVVIGLQTNKLNWKLNRS